MGLWIRCFMVLWLALPMQAQPAQVFEDSMAQRTLACTGCHGAQGRAGPDGYYPRLAGKPAGYLYQQLLNFRAGRRHYPLMTGLLDALDDAYLHALADYFAALSLPYAPPNPVPATAAELQRGRSLVLQGDPARQLPACSQCHGTALTGVQPGTPGLLGLPADYLNAQLGGWQTGQRHAAEPDCMARVARKLSAADTSAVARWLAAQPVPANASAAERRPVAEPVTLALRCGGMGEAVPAAAPAQMTATQAPDNAAWVVARGAYLARIGNCALCHTARGGPPYAGGRALETPFGAVYSSNLTSDPEHGIGAWSADDFWRALHEGLSRDGHALYPAFPYTSTTHIRRADSDDLLAYLRTVPAAAQANRAHALRWPFSTQIALRIWRTLFFSPASTTPVAASLLPGGNVELQRGAYLVQGLGHCEECHGARNALGALTGAADGSVLPGSQWFAPSLNDPAQASVAGWTVDEIARFLQTGVNDKAVASGPMAEVVLHGTQYLSDADARAMARYLKALPQQTRPREPEASATGSRALQRGAQIYDRQCADCHGAQGTGRAGVYPALAGNRAVTQTPPNNLIHTVLGGGFAPATAGHARPFGMPPFVLQLGDAEVAAVLSYIRNSWGNHAAGVSEFDINKFRRAQTP